MKRLASYLTAVVLLTVIAAQFTSCEKYVLPEVSVSPDTLFFDCKGATKSVSLTSNVAWKIELDHDEQEALNLSNSGGYESCTIDVTVAENLSKARTFVLTVQTEAFDRDLTIIQEGNPESENR